MKVLFVCRQNVGRSQMAKAIYNKITKSNDASSAGTHVLEVGQTLSERKKVSASKNFFVLDVMNDIGIDMSHYKRFALDKALLGQYDLIISMAKKDDTPEWLLDDPNYRFWDVADPRGMNYVKTSEVRDEITRRVNELIVNS